MEAWDARNADERTWRVVDTVGEIADAHHASSAQVALAWLGVQPAVTAVILGARTVAQLVDTTGAVDLDLTPAELLRLTDVSAPRVDDYPYGAAGVEQRNRKTAD